MAKFFSPTTRGFYDDAIHAPADIPADAIPLTADQHGSLLEAQARGLFITAIDGQVVAQEPSLDPDQLLAALRRKRDRLLRDTDFTQLPDAPLSAEERAAWADYRQALRDLPERHAEDPASVVWPTPPNQENLHVR